MFILYTILNRILFNKHVSNYNFFYLKQADLHKIEKTELSAQVSLYF